MSNKIELFIQARKGGYKILYSNPNCQAFYKFASDIQIGNSRDANLLGKSLYSLAFSNGQPIFSKFIIIYDEQRSFFGNVGFSIFVSNGFTLQSVYIKSLLDELSSHYIAKYCPSPDFRLGETQENWTEFAHIVQSYEEKLDHHESNDLKFISGNLKPALIYYSTDRELDQLFSDPYFEEFIPFKQVFIIDEADEGENDPANFFENSNEIIQPDYGNKKLHLKIDSHLQGVTLKAFVNNHWKNLSGNLGENIIQTSWTIHLHYKSPDPGFNDIDKKGKVNDPDLKPFFEISGNTIKPIINSSNLEPKKTRIKIQVSGYKPEDYSELEIIINGRRTEKGQVEITEEFQGNDFGKTFKVHAIDPKNSLSSDIKTIQSLDDIQIVRLQLLEEKRITISAFLENDVHNAIEKFEVTTIDSLGRSETVIPNQNGEIALRNRFNERPFTLKSLAIRNKVEYIGEKRDLEFEKTNVHISITLYKKINKQYSIDPGKNGELKDNCPDYSEDINGKDVVDFIAPNKGYKFDKFVINNRNDKITAQYIKKKSPVINNILIGLLFFATTGTAIYLLKDKIFMTKSEFPQSEGIDSTGILEYAQGNVLNKSKLEDYTDEIKNFQFDSTHQNLKQTLIEQIKNASDIRKYIDQGDFDKLKDKLKSPKQKNLKMALDSVDLSDTALLNELNFAAIDNLDSIAKCIRRNFKSKITKSEKNTSDTKTTTNNTSETIKDNQKNDQAFKAFINSKQFNPDEIRTQMELYKTDKVKYEALQICRDYIEKKEPFDCNAMSSRIKKNEYTKNTFLEKAVQHFTKNAADKNDPKKRIAQLSVTNP